MKPGEKIANPLASLDDLEDLDGLEDSAISLDELEDPLASLNEIDMLQVEGANTGNASSAPAPAPTPACSPPAVKGQSAVAGASGVPAVVGTGSQNSKPAATATSKSLLQSAADTISSVANHSFGAQDDDPSSSRNGEAEAVWKRIFRMLDYKNDHALTREELQAGLKLVMEGWIQMARLYPCGKAVLCQHLLRGPGADPKQQPLYLLNHLHEETDQLSDDELVEYARDCGVDMQEMTIAPRAIAAKIVEATGLRQSLANELSGLTDSMLEIRARYHLKTSLRTTLATNSEASSDGAWEIMTAGTVYVAGIPPGELEQEGHLTKVMEESFGTVLVCKVRVRSQPQLSWALVTFASPRSRDEALLEDGPTMSLLTEDHGLTCSIVDHHKARSSTGAFGEVWRECKEAISARDEQKLAQEAWRKKVVGELVKVEPEKSCLQSVHELARPAGRAILVTHLKTAGVDDVDGSQSREELLKLACEHAAVPSDLCKPHSAALNKVWHELSLLSQSELLDRVRSLHTDWPESNAEWDALHEILWESELCVALEKELDRYEQRAVLSALIVKAQGAGVADAELSVNRENLLELILQTRLSDLCTPGDITEALTPCCVALADTLGGKIPYSLDFLRHLQDVLDENPDAVTIADGKSFDDGSGTDIKPVFTRVAPLPNARVDDDPDVDGTVGLWLQKMSPSLAKGWQRRWFVFHPSGLVTYFNSSKKETAPTPDLKTQLDLKHCSRITTADLLGSTLQLHLPNRKVTLRVEERTFGSTRMHNALRHMERIFQVIGSNGGLGPGNDGSIQPITSEDDYHPAYMMVLKILTDPFLTYFVLPQMEAWQQIHTVLDLSRSGSVPFLDIKQGLQSCCSPDIDILQTKVQVEELLGSTRFVMLHQDMLTETAALTVDGPELSVVSRIRRTLADASYYCQQVLSSEWYSLQVATERVGHTVQANDGVEHLDKYLFALWRAAREMAKAIGQNMQGNSLALQKDLALCQQLTEMKQELTREVLPRCTRAMDFHTRVYMYSARNNMSSEHRAILKKYCAAYLLRRRLKLLSRVRTWAMSDNSALVKLQARMRGVVARRRLRKMHRSTAPSQIEMGSQALDMREIANNDWPLVLYNYLKHGDQDAREEAKMAFLRKLKRTREDQMSAEEDGAEVGASTDVEFPYCLLYADTMQAKLELLATARNRWAELLLMLDKNNTGSLVPLDIRCSLMAFSEMGIITELEELQPLNDNLSPWSEPARVFARNESQLQESRKAIGWDATEGLGWTGRQPFMAPFVRPGSIVNDFPIYLAPSQCILAGAEGVDVSHHAWALDLEFQFCAADPDVYNSPSRYNVLVTSYRNNAIVAKLCGSVRQPGIQLIFVKKDAFVSATDMISKCQQYEREGRDSVEEHFPSGRGTFEITPFIPMEQQRWYRLEIQGGRPQSSARTRHSDERLMKLRVRIDPLDHETREIVKREKPTYDKQGTYIPGAKMTKLWFDGPAEGLVNRPRNAISKKERSQLLRIEPWVITEWQGEVDFQDIYCIGNVFDNICCDASINLTWSIGAICNFRIYEVQKAWLRTELQAWPDSVRGSTTPAATSISEDKPDLRHFLKACSESSDHAVYIGGGRRKKLRKRRWAVRGLYQLAAVFVDTPKDPLDFPWGQYNVFSTDCILYQPVSLLCLADAIPFRPLWAGLKSIFPTGLNYPVSIQLQNDWNPDFEPGFAFSNAVVNRRNIAFVEAKTNRTSTLIKSFLQCIPSRTGDAVEHWQQDGDMKLDQTQLGVARASVASVHSGLNTLFTGPQMRKTMAAMGRSKKVNKTKCRSLFYFLLCPVFYARKLLFSRKKESIYDLGPAESILLYIRKATGQSPQVVVIGGIVIVWMLVLYVLVMRIGLLKSVLHELEAIIAGVYYVWASVLVATECSDEVVKLPSDNPFTIAYMKAEVSTMPIQLTRIGNGQQITTTIMGFVQMVCRLHPSEDDEQEDEEDDDEEQDPLKISRTSLQKFWVQSDLQESCPFAGDEVDAVKVIYDYEFEARVPPASPPEWEDQNDVFM
eukprot:COSAG06_NODE_2616_length_6576_cov_9.041686_1_plen_2031_part_00